MRFFFVNGPPTSTNNVLMGDGKLTLRRLTLTGGRVSGGTSFSGGGGGMGAGAWIFAQGTVLLDQVLISLGRVNGGSAEAAINYRVVVVAMFGHAGLSTSTGGGTSGGGAAWAARSSASTAT